MTGEKSSKEGENSVSAVQVRTWLLLHFAHMGFLKKHMAKACGTTFVPFYSAEMGNLSENGTKVAQLQHEMWILIENGNEVG